METRSLLIGLSSFIAGGLLVSIAATTFEKPKESSQADNSMASSMQETAGTLKKKTGNDFDKAFITEMIAHHQGAIDMAKLAKSNAKHEEIKQLSQEIVTAQEKEIGQMKQWQMDWGYGSGEILEEHNQHDM